MCVQSRARLVAPVPSTCECKGRIIMSNEQPAWKHRAQGLHNPKTVQGKIDYAKTCQVWIHRAQGQHNLLHSARQD